MGNIRSSHELASSYDYVPKYGGHECEVLERGEKLNGDDDSDDDYDEIYDTYVPSRETRSVTDQRRGYSYPGIDRESWPGYLQQRSGSMDCERRPAQRQDRHPTEGSGHVTFSTSTERVKHGVVDAATLSIAEYNALVIRKRNDQGQHECEVLAYDTSETEDTAECCVLGEDGGPDNSIPAAESVSHHLPGEQGDQKMSEQEYRALAERKRNDQGKHECEVPACELETLEGHMEWKYCGKNPGHTSFIPASEFCLDHLPSAWQRQDTWHTVRMLVDTTVRLRVGYTSMDRPDGYIFNNVRGTRIPHTGSGWVFSVTRHSGQACPCDECDAGPSSPGDTRYDIQVATACHVVYNSEEARSTQVDLFYDDETSIQDGRMKTVWGCEVLETDTENDVTILRCVTYDLDLGKQLKDLYDSGCTYRRDERLAINALEGGNDRGCVLVSHPHGRPKQVTVGEIQPGSVSRHGEAVVYTARSCPGSSGGPVYRFNQRNRWCSSWIHSGKSDLKPLEQGFSSRGFPTMLF